MCRFTLGILFVVLFFLNQPGIVFAVAGGAQVKGAILFRGVSLAAKTHQIKVDEKVCGKTVQIQTVQVNESNSGLRSVVGSVKNAPSIGVDVAYAKRIMANAHCLFSPRVEAARMADILEIQNRDQILHNTHIKKGERTFLNVAQLAGSRFIPKTLKRTGLHTFRCDKHTFMTGALLVFNHPYFAVTDEFGGYSLPHLPAGTYTIAVWHETLGSLQQNIIVPTQGSVTINFEYL